MEVDVFAGLFSRKEGQVLGLQLVWIVQYGSWIETSLRKWNIIFDPYESKAEIRNYTSTMNNILFLLKCFYNFCSYLD